MSEQRKKVLLIIPNLGSGGAQRVFHQHRVLLAKDFDVVACTFNYDGAFDHEKKGEIISLDVAGGNNPVSKLLRFFERVRKLKQLKKKYHIDVSISHLEGADYVNVLSKTNDKIVLWIHGTKLHDGNISGLTGWLRKNILIPRLYSRADRIICVSDGINEELKNVRHLNEKKIHTVHNGINLHRIQEQSNQPVGNEWNSIFSSGNFIVTHCRLAAQKNLSALIDIIAKMNGVGYKWLILGDGEERLQLLDRCQKHGLKTYDAWSDVKLSPDYTVYFAGLYENPFSMLSFGSLYVLTSRWEGFPLSLCEALACGLPIVSSDCFTGPREILSTGNENFGFLMPVPDDEATKEQWAAKIHRLMNDKELRSNISNKAKGRANEFSEELFYSRTVSQISSLSS